LDVDWVAHETHIRVILFRTVRDNGSRIGVTRLLKHGKWLNPGSLTGTDKPKDVDEPNES